MPELPEVQTIVDDLRKKVIARRIVGVFFYSPKIIKRLRTLEFKKQIKGLKITGVQRRGKNILIYLIQKSIRQLADKNQNDNSKIKIFLLLIHQKMTGHLLYGKWGVKKVSSNKFQVISLIKGPLREKVNGYIHLIFYLDNGWQLALSDLRKFAKVLFGRKEEIKNLPDLKRLGPEPLDESFKVDKFISLISLEKRKIKQVLMDQEVISGIGNIYSDEILWQVKIHPFTPANQLTNSQLKDIYSAMRRILKKAIKLRGTSISDFRDISGKSGAYADVRKVYAKEGERCQRCQTLIKRIKIGGRSAHFCPKCQKI